MPTSPLNESVAVVGVHDALPISTDATTSRTVVNNGAVRVVAFAMDAGQELTEHGSARPVAVLTVEGELRLTVDGTAHEMAPGDVVYLAPGARHAVLARTPCRFALVLAAQPVEAG